MKSLRDTQQSKFIKFALIAFVGWLTITFLAWVGERNLWSVAHITGYTLFVIILTLVFFKARKRLLVLPLGTIRDWKLLHFVLGAVSLPLYFQHTGTFWPEGRYEQFIAVFFYAVSLSGLFGVILQRLYPRKLTDLGDQVIFERIPTELALLREEAQALVLLAARETSSHTLSRYYGESLYWFFQRPRFTLSHLLGTGRSEGWIQTRLFVLEKYMDPSESIYLKQLEAIALRKNGLDAHYAMQGALKLWLFVHVPVAVLLVLLACWHLIVINIYAS
jgi:hypothetical protein